MADPAKPDPSLKEVEDTKKELKKAQKFKPAPGVDFVQYDELGFDKNDKETEDLRKFITTDKDVLDTVVLAPPEVLEKSLAMRTGEQVHADKEYKDLDEEGK